MTVDTSITELTQELADLKKRQAELDADKEKFKAKAIEHCRGLIKSCGLSEHDLFGKPRRKSGIPPTAKYRNPNGTEVWSGIGKHPKWFDDAIAAGYAETDLIIHQAEEQQ